jgi:hypothetical protein
MKFELMSFLAAMVVYVVRLRVQYVSGTRPLYSGSFLENRPHCYMPDYATSPAESAADPSEADRVSDRHYSGEFQRGCGRAVAVMLCMVLIRFTA